MRQYLKNDRSGFLTEVNGYFQGSWEEIATHNLYMLKRSSVIALGVLTCYLVYSLYTRQTTGEIVVYAVCLAFHAGFCCFIQWYAVRLRWRPRMIWALSLGWLVSLFVPLVYSVSIGTPETPGIYFAPFTLVLSMVFILPPWQNATVVSATVLAFLFLSGYVKQPEVFRLDIASGVVTWVLCMILDVEILSIRLKDYRLHRELMRLSRTDCLTGLMNKNTTETAARSYLKGCGTREYAALFVIDLDQFKQINDALGHQAGDEALEMVGNTLLKLFRAKDIVGRVGGDEFVALMKNANDRKVVARRACAICDTVRHTRLEHHSLSLTCSVGVATCPTHGTTYDMLFHSADEQLYAVKRSGKDGYRLAR